MPKEPVQQHARPSENSAGAERSQPVLHQRTREIQPFGRIADPPIAADEMICLASMELLNQIRADSMTSIHLVGALLQAWFIAERRVGVPLARADSAKVSTREWCRSA